MTILEEPGRRIRHTSRNGFYWNHFTWDTESNYAPVLELPATVEGGLRVVDVDRGTDHIQIVVRKGQGVTAPSAIGITPPSGSSYTMDQLRWLDPGKYSYLPGEHIPAGVSRLAAYWLDQEPPVISGLEDGKTYCGEVQFTATDASGRITVYVGANSTPLQAGAEGKYTILPADGEQTIEVGDGKGNWKTVTVTVNNGHTYWQQRAPDGAGRRVLRHGQGRVVSAGGGGV